MAGWLWFAPLVPLVCYVAYWIVPTKKNKVYSFAIGEAVPGETIPRRNKISKELITHPQGCHTLWESFKRACDKNGKLPCLGDRETLEVVQKDRIINGEAKPWTFYKRGPFKWITFKETYDIVTQFASGLRAIGLEPVCIFFFLFFVNVFINNLFLERQTCCL